MPAPRAFALALVLATLVGCSPTYEPPPASPAAPTPVASTSTEPGAATPTPAPAATPPCHQALASGEAAKATVYDLPVPLTDAAGNVVDLGAERGHPVLVSMMYTSCKQACPLLIHNLESVLEGLSPRAKADVRVVLVSFDPARDTPKQLAAVAAERGLDSHWRLLTASGEGAEDAVRDVAAVLGFQYRKQADGDYNHSSVISLLDRTGVIQMRVEDLGSDRAALLAAVEKMVNEGATTEG